ncbi:MAG: tetratricopeptide repeat protein [Steroidobacteraceae bacterium]
MLKRIAAPLTLVLALACTGPVRADTDPTIAQVYTAARSGHLDQAQQMMNQVLRDHPNSGKAHYVEAELSARAANFPRAREELATAQRLDPTGSFAKPENLAALQRELARGTSSGYRTATAPRFIERPHASIPWGLILTVVAGVVIAWTLLSRRSPQQYRGYPQYPGGVPPAGGPVGYGPAGYGPQMGGGMGSGIVGGLASGLAIGAGVAAGEELVHHMIDGNGNRVEAPPGYVPSPDDNSNMGGNDFGVSDSSSWDDNGGSFGGGDSGGGGGGGDWT